MPSLFKALRSGKDKDPAASSSFTTKEKDRAKLAQFRPRVWVGSGFSRRVARLDESTLDRVFYFLCPHSSDDKYRTSEETISATGDGCVLCQTRDLAACSQINRHWHEVARKRLYKSIRFESIHYCDREDWLRKHRKNKHAPDKIDEIRLMLLERSLARQSHPSLPRPGELVEILKFTYQVREGYKSHLARIVSSTPSLRYADLPDGVFSDHESCEVLKQQLIARCPDLRFMKYKGGAEGTFARHAYEDFWYNLEAVSLEGLDIEPDALTYVLARMLNMTKLNLENMAVLSDAIFQPNPNFHALPAIRTLKIGDAPNVTAYGLLSYLGRPEVSASITTLQLENTGVQVADVHVLLAAAAKLRTFAIRTKVSHAMPSNSAQPMVSRSIRQIFFEISNEASHHSVGVLPCDSYYEYLASSIAATGLPCLRSVRTYCPQFPDLLISLAPPPPAPFTGGGGGGGGGGSGSGGGQSLVGSRPAGVNMAAASAPGMPPRLSVQPGSLAPPILPSPGMPASLANRMSTLSLGSGGPSSHARSHSTAAPYLGPPSLSATVAQRPSSSYGIGYNTRPFSSMPGELAQTPAAVPPVPPDIVARLGLSSGGLTIYTKPPDAEEMEWLVTELVMPEISHNGRTGISGGIRGARPISLMNMQRPSTAGGTGSGQDLSWLGDEAYSRDSGQFGRDGLTGSHGGQLVGNGFGGYVEVKDEGRRSRRKGADWMG